jgi:lysophosphatidylcholine acyltransferase / lyso-PAF acetyltransferase
MAGQKFKKAFGVSMPYMTHGRLEGYLRIPIAMCLWYFFFRGAAAPFYHHGDSTGAPATWVFFTFMRVYLCANGLFLVTLFLVENIRCLVVPGPIRLSLEDDYVNGNPPHVDKMKAFEYDTPLTTYERVKIGFFVATGIVFVRFFTAVTTIFIGLFSASMAGYYDRYAHPWWFGFWVRVTKLLAIITLSVLGMHNIQFYGEFADRKECKFLISNHSCVTELILLFAMADFPSFVSRRENLAFPFMGNILKCSESILVDRDAAASRAQTQEAIFERAKDPKAPPLMVFPEGTTGNQQTLFLFKKGVFATGAPVQMVCFAFPYKHFNAAWTGREVGGNSLSDILLRLSCQFINHAEARALPVYYPTEDEQKNPILYASHCQKMMATVLHANVSDATFKDYKEASKLYAESKKRQ